MPTTIVHVEVSGGDADETRAGTVGLTALETLLQNKPETESTKEVWGVRFTNVEIPAGATVSKANLYIWCPTGGKTAMKSVIRSAYEGNPAAFTTTKGSLGTYTLEKLPVVQWEETLTTNAYNKSPSFAIMAEKVFQRFDWVSGNAMVFLLQEIALSGGQSSIENWNKLSATTHAAKLEIEWTEHVRTNESLSLAQTTSVSLPKTAERTQKVTAPAPMGEVITNLALLGSSVESAKTVGTTKKTPQATQVEATAKGTVTDIWLLATTATTATKIQVGIFKDNEEAVGSLIVSKEFDVGTLTKTTWLRCSGFSLAIPTIGTKYWLAFVGVDGSVQTKEAELGGKIWKTGFEETVSLASGVWKSFTTLGPLDIYGGEFVGQPLQKLPLLQPTVTQGTTLIDAIKVSIAAKVAQTVTLPFSKVAQFARSVSQGATISKSLSQVFQRNFAIAQAQAISAKRTVSKSLSFVQSQTIQGITQMQTTFPLVQGSVVTRPLGGILKTLTVAVTATPSFVKDLTSKFTLTQSQTISVIGAKIQEIMLEVTQGQVAQAAKQIGSTLTAVQTSSVATLKQVGNSVLAKVESVANYVVQVGSVHLAGQETNASLSRDIALTKLAVQNTSAKMIRKAEFAFLALQTQALRRSIALSLSLVAVEEVVIEIFEVLNTGFREITLRVNQKVTPAITNKAVAKTISFAQPMVITVNTMLSKALNVGVGSIAAIFKQFGRILTSKQSQSTFITHRLPVAPPVSGRIVWDLDNEETIDELGQLKGQFLKGNPNIVYFELVKNPLPHPTPGTTSDPEWQ